MATQDEFGVVSADEAAAKDDPESLVPSLAELAEDAGSSALWDGASPRTAQAIGYEKLFERLSKTASAMEKDLDMKDREVALCTCCGTKEATHVLISCGHTACEACAQRLFTESQSCPSGCGAYHVEHELRSSARPLRGALQRLHGDTASRFNKRIWVRLPSPTQAVHSPLLTDYLSHSL